jgi:hypothetical protein
VSCGNAGPTASTTGHYIRKTKQGRPYGRALKPSPRRVGQNKLPKWAKITCQSQAKIARLRRQSKDMLIARVLELETAVANQGMRENALREEVLRLTFKAAQPGN